MDDWQSLKEKAIDLQEYSAASYYDAMAKRQTPTEPKPSAETEARIRTHKLKPSSRPDPVNSGCPLCVVGTPGLPCICRRECASRHCRA
jgi:hypothetical protein